uniref:PGG domain-containing protein n=1 Tax=Oryza nivara TaxID=4536 RepID=A0A0E0HP53_ORYNI
MSGWLMVLAVLAASVTYHAGLNPPGGIWQHNDGESHVAGTPVHRVLLINATAFVTSVVIIILLMNESFYHSEAKVVALEIIAVLDMVCLMGAYIAGSTRAAPCSIYVTVLTVVVFLYVVYAAELLRKIWWLIIHAPVHDTAATGGGKLPAVPQHIVEQASPHHRCRADDVDSSMSAPPR